jgi:serine/threonine-protein kinase
MEYVEGRTLRVLLQAVRKSNERIPLEHVLTIGIQVAGALQHAHSKGIIHRDVSPRNVLVTYEGGLKLVDFGIAKATSRQSLTHPGIAKGTLVYMSPEQCIGGHVDRRTDIFSLGIVLYELVTGQRPFPTDDPVELVSRIALDEVPSPALLAPDLPPVVTDILLKALRRDPDERFATAEDLGLALEQAGCELRLAASQVTLGRFVRELLSGPSSPAAPPDSVSEDHPSEHTAPSVATESVRGDDEPPEGTTQKLPRARSRAVLLVGAVALIGTLASVAVQTRPETAAVHSPPAPVATEAPPAAVTAPEVVSTAVAIAPPSSTALHVAPPRAPRSVGPRIPTTHRPKSVHAPGDEPLP